MGLVSFGTKEVQKMKKLLSIFYAVLLCGLLTFSIFAASATDGIYFNDRNFMYDITNDLEAEPMTIEADIYLDKNTQGVCGSYFGTYHWDDRSHTMDIHIDENGRPILRIRYGPSDWYAYHPKTDLRQSRWINVAFVRDAEAKRVRFYIDGELESTYTMRDAINNIHLFDFKVGSNLSYMNPDYFKGGIKSLKVYSDVRTQSEIKSDMSSLDKSDLLLAYDFTGKNDRPKTITDLSGNGHDAVRNLVFYDSEPVDPSTYAYTFAVVGDTQNMVKSFAEKWPKLNNYIYDNIEKMNIEAVLGLGDITDTKTGPAEEWDRALEGFRTIDDFTLNIPITGDHDSIYRYNQYISKLNYADIVTRYDDTDLRNGYIATEIGGVPYLFIQLEKGANDSILTWANNVVAAHPNHNVIVTTHAYLYYDYTFHDVNDNHTAEMTNYADQVWDKFISKHENIVLVLCGHIGHDYIVVNQRKGNKGNIVTEMLLDFQSVDNAAQMHGFTDDGVGVVNMFHFSEDGKKLTVETYSTALDKHFMELNQITLDIDMHNTTKYVRPEKEPLPPRANLGNTVEMTVDSTTATLNGNAATLDTPMIVKDGVKMIPARFVAHNLGAYTSYDKTTKKLVIKSADVKLEITAGTTEATVNGKAANLSVSAFVDEGGCLYVALDDFVNNLGVTVTLTNLGKTVTLTGPIHDATPLPESETVIYENDFSSSSTLSDFKQYRANWEIRDGHLYVTNKGFTGTADGRYSHLIYQADEPLEEYILEVDMMNVQTSAGLIFNSQQSKVGTGASAFYGYCAYLSKDTNYMLVGDATRSGGWNTDFLSADAYSGSSSNTNIHLTVIVKDGKIGINAYDIDTKKCLVSNYHEFDNQKAINVWIDGTVGLRAMLKSGDLINYDNMYFDNFRVTTAKITDFDSVVYKYATVSEVKDIDTSTAYPIYTNTFDDANSVKDFKQFNGTWEVKNGSLYLAKSSGSNALFIYNGENWLKNLRDYVLDVDMYNVQTQGGAIVRSQIDLITGKQTNGNDFRGYFALIAYTGNKTALAYTKYNGDWGNNFLVSDENILSRGSDVHIQVAVKNELITYTLTNKSTGATLWKYTTKDRLWAHGSFGFRIYAKTYSDGSSNINLTNFDNLVISVFPHTCEHTEWTVTTPPTMLSNGVETSICPMCGSKETRTIPYLESPPLSLSVGSAQALTQNEVTVAVSIVQESGFGNLSFSVEFDTDILSLTAVDTLGTLAGFSYKTSANGCIDFSYSGTANVIGNGNAALLTFRVLEDAPDGITKLQVSSPSAFIYIGQEKVDLDVTTESGELDVHILGDVNDDGAVALYDCLSILKTATARGTLDYADMNGDGVISLADALRAFKALAN